MSGLSPVSKLIHLLKHDTQFCVPNDGEKLFLKHKVNMFIILSRATTMVYQDNILPLA